LPGSPPSDFPDPGNTRACEASTALKPRPWPSSGTIVSQSAADAEAARRPARQARLDPAPSPHSCRGRLAPSGPPYRWSSAPDPSPSLTTGLTFSVRTGTDWPACRTGQGDRLAIEELPPSLASRAASPTRAAAAFSAWGHRAAGRGDWPRPPWARAPSERHFQPSRAPWAAAMAPHLHQQRFDPSRQQPALEPTPRPTGRGGRCRAGIAEAAPRPGAVGINSTPGVAAGDLGHPNRGRGRLERAGERSWTCRLASGDCHGRPGRLGGFSFQAPRPQVSERPQGWPPPGGPPDRPDPPARAPLPGGVKRAGPVQAAPRRKLPSPGAAARPSRLGIAGFRPSRQGNAPRLGGPRRGRQAWAGGRVARKAASKTSLRPGSGPFP